MSEGTGVGAGVPEQTGRLENPLRELARMGQSVWLDYIRRDMLENGELEELISRGVRGVTSNPALFEQAIARSDDYADDLETLAAEGAGALEAYEEMAVRDVQLAADLLLGVYEESQGQDGFVSLEVSPELAHDAMGTLEEARRLWRQVERPNLMIKIPGTPECIPAIRQALVEGMNINITLLFSLDGYRTVMKAYLEAMEERAGAGRPLAAVASVASFFISRVDTAVDRLLEERLQETGEEERLQILSLRGQAGIANAKLAYQQFREVFEGERFRVLKEVGARVQRPLWASTSTKNPAYREAVYVEELIGPDTVNTMPLATLEAFAARGRVRPSLTEGVERAQEVVDELARLGIELEEVTQALQREGVEKFVLPYRELLEVVDRKLGEVPAGR